MKSFIYLLMGCVIFSNIGPSEADFMTGVITGIISREADKHLLKKVEAELPEVVVAFLSIIVLVCMLMICIMDPKAGAGIIVGGLVADILDPPNG